MASSEPPSPERPLREPPSREPDAAAEASDSAAPVAMPVARAVAEDLESIFPQDAPARGPAARKLRLGMAREPRSGLDRRGRERRLAGVGALIAAACVGVSAGALFGGGASAPRSAPPPVSPGAPIAISAPALPPPGPLPTPAPLASAPLEASPPTAEVVGFLPAADPAPAKLADANPRAAARHPRPAHAVAKCGRRARCGPSSLTAADARLRRAYASAERAGVPHAVLADYRQEWSRLRRRAPRQPTVVAARYRQMAGSLSRMAAHQRVARAEPPRPGPWRRFRMQVAALWR